MHLKLKVYQPWTFRSAQNIEDGRVWPAHRELTNLMHILLRPSMLVISKQISKAVLVILKQTAQKCGIST
jgi:hypothetical protein